MNKILLIVGVALVELLCILFVVKCAGDVKTRRQLNEIEANLEVINRFIDTMSTETPRPSEAGGSESLLVIPDATFVFPVAADDWYVSSHYGKRVSPIYRVYRYHNGMDISVQNPRLVMPQIVAIADGVIRDHWYTHESRGRYIVIDHGNGMVSSYSHLSESYIRERRSNGSRWRVKAGEVIGRMGDTGIADGAHLHFEIEINGDPVNPALYLAQFLEEWQ
jgi:murein DD-endopeptidase MepM/ murein hydrolase activator NlpD